MSDTTTQSASRYFTFQGRRYRIEKRSPQRDAPWYFCGQVNGHRFNHALDTNNAAAAQSRAVEQCIRPALSSKWEDLRPVRRAGGTTIGQAVDLYAAHATDFVKPRTAHDIAAMFLKFAAEVLRTDRASVLTRPVAALTADAVERWKEHTVKTRTARLTGDALEAERQSAMYYCNRVIGQSRALFSKPMLRVFARAGHDDIPAAIAQLKSVPNFTAVRVHRERAPDSMVDATIAAADTLREADLELFKLFWLILATGLRRGEIIRAHWENFQTVDGSLEYKSDALGKDGERIRIPVIGSAYAKLSPLAKDTGPILEGNPDRTFRRFGTWMRGHGWKTSKTTHELRNLIISRIITKYGMVTGSRFARHKDIRTTERFYASYVRPQNLDVDL